MEMYMCSYEASNIWTLHCNVVQLITLMNAIMTVERNGSEMETVIQKLKCVVVLEPRFISLWVE